MKYCIISVILLLTASHIVVAWETPTNEYVKFTVALKEKSSRSGTTANLLFRLQPKKGIHINLKPPIKIVFDSTGTMVKAGKAVIPQADTFLNVSKPIQQPITLTA